MELDTLTNKIRYIRSITSFWSVGLRQISCSKKYYPHGKSVSICAIRGRHKYSSAW